MLKNPAKPFRSSVSAVVNRSNKLGRMVKNQQWRYVEWDDAKMGVELYDQKKHPTEYNNLANDPT
ncbi:iduronate-2-sulfatase, partial [bacterium]|nr:iduronate-2-sulfatase [bacterium]